MKQLRSRPSYLLFLTLCTAAYLVVELSFNARLLDTAGGLVVPEQVQAIEHWGRLISGVAVLLIVWGSWILPQAEKRKLGRSKTALAVAGAAFVVLPSVYLLERAIVDARAEAADAEQRRRAVVILALKHALQTGALGVHGLNVTPEMLSSPEGKSFVALFPSLLMDVEGIDAHMAPTVRDLVRAKLEEKVGDARRFYMGEYTTYSRQMKDGFTKYYNGDEEYLRQINQAPEAARKHWQNYVNELGRRGYTADTVPFFGYDEVRQGLRSQGLPVPDSWVPSDQRGFLRMVIEEVRRRADAEYERQMQSSALGAVLPHNLHWPQFVEHPAVQEAARRQAPFRYLGTLPVELKFDEFQRMFYEPLVASYLDQIERAFATWLGRTAAGQPNSPLGVDAMLAILVPPMALGISLVGALFHSFKLANYLLCYVSRRTWINATALGLSALAIVLWVFWQPNQITQSPAFQDMKTALGGQVPLRQAVATWVIQAQSFAYPVHETTRRYVMQNCDFGCTPGAYDGRARGVLDVFLRDFQAEAVTFTILPRNSRNPIEGLPAACTSKAQR